MIVDHKAVESLTKTLQNTMIELGKVEAELTTLMRKQSRLVYEIETLRKTLEVMTGKKSPLPIESMPKTHPKFLQEITIGDAIERVLKSLGLLTKGELLIILQEAGVKLGESNPRGSLHNAIKRDARNRFVVLANGKVALRTENEKADGNG